MKKAEYDYCYEKVQHTYTQKKRLKYMPKYNQDFVGITIINFFPLL
jgi:hypothetical protein